MTTIQQLNANSTRYMTKQIKIGEAYTYDRSQANNWCYEKMAEGFAARFTAKKVGNRRLYTVRWFKK